MADGRLNTGVDNDAPIDFSVKRDHVTPTTSSQGAVTSLPVVAAPPVALFRPLMEPTLMSALSAAAGLLQTTAALSGGAATTPVSDVTALQVRAYVQSKIAEQQRRLTTGSSRSS